MDLKAELIKKYQDLSLDDKRNEFNQELIVISGIVNMLMNSSSDMPYNYRKKVDLSKSEDEYLNDNYPIIVDIKNNLMAYMDKLSK